MSGTSYTRNYLSQKNLGTLRHSTLLRRILWVVLIGYTTEMVHLLSPLNVCVCVLRKPPCCFTLHKSMSEINRAYFRRSASIITTPMFRHIPLESFLLLEFALPSLVIGVARVLQCVQLYITTQLLLSGCQQKLHALPPSATSNCHRNYLNTIATVFNIMLSTIYCLRVDVVAYNVQKHVIL